MIHSSMVRRDRNPVLEKPMLFAFGYFAWPDPDQGESALFGAGHMIATSEQEAMEMALESAYADLPEEQGFWGHEAVVHLIPLDVLESIMNWYRQVAQQKTMHVAQRRTTEQPMRAVERPTRRRGGNGR
jgi:hypothetical protein